MASNLTITDEFGVVIPDGALDFGPLERLIASSPPFKIQIHNDQVQAGGFTTATGLLLIPFFRPTQFDPLLASGYEPADAQFLQWRLTGVIIDPTSGTSGGDPQDYIGFATNFLPAGGRAPAILPNIPPEFGRELELIMFPTTSGGPFPLDEIVISLDEGRGIFARDVLDELVEGNVSLHRWQRSRHRIVAGVQPDRAAEVTESPSTANAPVIQHVTFKVNGWPVKAPIVEMSAISNTDFNGDGLLTGEQFDVLIVKDPDRDFTATGYTIIKGVKGLAGAQIPPTSSGIDDIVIAFLARRADVDGGGLTDIRNRQRHDDGYLLFDGGLDATIGERTQLEAGLISVEEGQVPVTTLPMSSRGVITAGPTKVTGSQVGIVPAGLSILGGFETNATDVTAVDQRGMDRAPDLYLARRIPLKWSGRGDDVDMDGRIPLFGRLFEQNASGALPQTLTNAAGYRAYALITGFTTFGSLRFNGFDISTGFHTGGKLGESSVNEDHIVDKVDDWVFTRSRFAGTVGNSPDVTITATGGLVANIESGIAEPFQWNGTRFQVGALVIRFVPRSAISTLRFQMLKVPALGSSVETIFNTGSLTQFGPGSTIMWGRWNQRWLDTTPTGDLCEGLVEEPPPVSVIDPMIGGSGFFPWGGGQGVVAFFDEVLDIGPIEADLYLYQQVIS